MVYSLTGKDVLENTVEHDCGAHKSLHAFFFLTRHEGRLRRLAVETLAA
jgi:hypothetical protein